MSTCEWFALCDNPAAGTVRHPILGDVPTCATCAGKLDLHVEVPRAGAQDEHELVGHPAHLSADASKRDHGRRILPTINRAKESNVYEPTDPDELSELLTIFPNAERHWGFYGVDIPWGSNETDYIIVTNDEGDQYAIGIYLDGRWMEGHEPDRMVVVNGAAAAIAFVNDITDLQPEGTDWGAWVLQWISDASADRRIVGEHRPWDADDEGVK